MMEMRMRSPKDDTHHAHIKRLAPGYNRRVSAGKPNPYAETYPVESPYAQLTVPIAEQIQQSPSVSHTLDTNGFGYDGTSPEITPSQAIGQDLSDASASTSEPPSETPPHMQNPDSAKVLRVQPLSCRDNPTHHRPFTAFSTCCSISRHDTPPAVVQDISNDSKIMGTTTTLTQRELEGDSESVKVHSYYPPSGTCCLRSHRSSREREFTKRLR
jgi:hypothetical protein